MHEIYLVAFQQQLLNCNNLKLLFIYLHTYIRLVSQTLLIKDTIGLYDLMRRMTPQT